jgi:hypothetical protein
VLRALGRDTQLAQSSLRFSLGRFTSPEDVDFAVAAVRQEVERLRSLSPAADSPSPELRGAGEWVSGEAGGPGQEVWVRVHLRVQGGGTVKDARFKTYGCPHTLSVTAWLAEQLPGRTRADLLPGTPASWAEALSVPEEKLGRLLVVEDALNDCVRHWSRDA